MLMKVFPHGTGDGDRPVRYLIREDIPSRKEHPPEVLRGDPKLTAELINSIERRWKFTSGVLAWHPDDDVNEAQERDVMDAFERVAFAGLDADQRHILWVRHRHAGHHELHFLIPRMELSSGKDFNACPPGWQKDFSVFRDLFNWREGWARPDDPAHARDFLPDKADLLHAQAVRWNRKIKSSNRDEAKATITELLKNRLAQGDIKSREDVLHILKEEGLHISRTGKDYIGVVVPEFGLRVRLKGGIFVEGWHPKKEASEDEVRPDKQEVQKRISSLEEELERVLEKRKRINRKRYPVCWPELAENLEDIPDNERNRTPAYRGVEKDGRGEPAELQGLCQPSAPARRSDASSESRSGRTAEFLRRCWEAVRELAEFIAQAERRKREREEDSFRMRM
ncbi:MAG: relaxase/mobilization nuclease domain-containing protein [Mailhella sp.]|nr:relaxase/mobilization nuclease domain-containing protein [Mailhella sp.]MBQ8743952.1 relaxase/mobilization nuclease domain-containing protein [Mailhella sp.]